MAWDTCMSAEGYQQMRNNVEAIAASPGRHRLAQALANDAFTRMRDAITTEYILPDVLPPGLASRSKKVPGRDWYALHIRRWPGGPGCPAAAERKAYAAAMALPDDVLTDAVCRQIERHNKSSNGGHQVYADSQGLEQIPVDPIYPGHWMLED